jgi:hypothetical protein
MEYVSPYEIAVYYAQWETATIPSTGWKSLRGAVGAHGRLRVEEFFEPFHSDPRYIDLLKRVGLPQ